MNVVNTHQAEAWNGYEGRHWADHQQQYDTANGGMDQPIFETAALAESDHVLDIGCGNGRTTRLAAQQARHGHVMGIDLSAPMLERARASATAEGLANVAFVQGDAQVYPFGDAEFDVAISRGGIMFFADPVAAFTNIARALRPNGRLAIVCPQDVAPDSDFARALAPLWGLARRAVDSTDPAPTESAGPTSLADSKKIHQVLDAAGFTKINVTPITAPMVFGRTAAEACDFFFDMGPMRFNLQSAEPTERGEAHAAVTRSLLDFEASGAVTLNAALWLVDATRSAC